MRITHPQRQNHIFRLDEAGKIVEQWDDLQTIPEQLQNANGMSERSVR